MHFVHFFNQTLRPMGFDIVNTMGAVQRPYGNEDGWPLVLPECAFTEKTLVIVHFPDFITLRKDGTCVELEQVEKFYGANADRVLITHWTHDLDKFYTGPMNLIRFSNHNYELCNELAMNFDQWKDLLSYPRTHDWQCLNGRICTNRRKAADILQSWPNGWLSLGTDIRLPEWDYSNYFGCDNFLNLLRLKYVYGSAAVNIVNETEYFSVTGIVTEKTLLAIAAEQVPIVIGHKGIVDQCRRMGFDMFDDLVDTSYEEFDYLDRVEQAILRNKDLIQGKINLAPYKRRLERNREFLLWEFTRRMEREFVIQAHTLADRLLPTYTT